MGDACDTEGPHGSADCSDGVDNDGDGQVDLADQHCRQQCLTALDGAPGDRFGRGVSISGDVAVVGAVDDDDAGSSSGSAYVFERDGSGNWGEVAKLTASDAAANDRFGSVGVSISGDTVLVPARGDDDQAGSAYVFERDGSGNWSEAAKLTASDAAALDLLGFDASISGDRVLVGAPGDDDLGYLSGSAYVFERDGSGNWSEVAKLTASDAMAGDRFGNSVSISGDKAIVGAFLHDDPVGGVDSGSAYVFERDGSGNWSEVAKLTASDAAAGDWFGGITPGGGVSISGDKTIVGAVRQNHVGSAYVFERDGSGNWSEVAKLNASDAAWGDAFGISVSISGDKAIVGDENDDDLGFLSGSAYVFERDESGDWSEVAKLNALGGAPVDLFGHSVSISGDKAIVGALGAAGAPEGAGFACIFDPLLDL